MSEIKHCVILVAYHESSSELLDAKASFTLLLLDVKSFKIPKLLIILYLIFFINYPEELIRDLSIIHGSAISMLKYLFLIFCALSSLR